MYFNLKINYNDGKVLEVILEEKECAPFFEALSQGQVFWDSEFKKGFWTSVESIRFIEVVPSEVATEKPEAVEPEGKVLSGEVPIETEEEFYKNNEAYERETEASEASKFYSPGK